jgi:hypothetical protein
MLPGATGRDITRAGWLAAAAGRLRLDTHPGG